ncbi:unnamed protein product [Ceratitis capitata]|uniref:(Mediterranean fruit fly) hypothetical protein n=1 Tax=Ceratitis capitata TaxID=7213 RepID=A0A811UV86_CERCA|nr:unnamed protein product [Ceratitis capitata]
MEVECDGSKSEEATSAKSLRIANQMAKELKISDRSIRRIPKNGLMVKPYMIQEAYDPSHKQQQVR